MKRLLMLLPILLATQLCVTQAQARTCPHGQVLLVHKGQCMERSAFHDAIHHRVTRVSLPKEEVPSHAGLTYVHVIDPAMRCVEWQPASTGWPISWFEARGLVKHDRWVIR